MKLQESIAVGQVTQRVGNDAAARATAYRGDIDGLRAIAVMSVIAFHASKTALPGGYLGVDIFFVISGFLITGILTNPSRKGLLLIGEFYERRARRILPALLTVLTASTIVGSMLLMANDLTGYARSLLATLTFCANFYFWRDTNYFSTSAEEKPLLHNWSLSVEEQFYIIFPLMLWLLLRYARAWTFQLILALTVSSLVLNVAAHYVGGHAPAFFLLPTRAWELGIGAVLALLPDRLSASAQVAPPLGLAGLAALAATLAWPPETYGLMPAPVPAVAATALVIYGGRASGLGTRLLSIRPLVLVGLVSYSLYLWHWPVLVYAKYYLVRDLRFHELIAALALMLGLSWLTWRFIERPFRSSAMSLRTLMAATGVVTAILLGAAAVLIALHGAPGRYQGDAARINAAAGTNYRCPVSEYMAFGSGRACGLNLPSRNPSEATTVLLGNSHAQMYAPIVRDRLVAAKQAGLLVPANFCLPTDSANLDLPCLEIARGNLRAILGLPKVDTVVIGLTWEHADSTMTDPTGRPLENRKHEALIAAVDELISQLNQAGKHVVLIGPIAQPGWNLASEYGRRLAYGWVVDKPLSTSGEAFALRFKPVFDHFGDRPDLTFVRPDRLQCASGDCQYVLDGQSLFADSNHVAATALPLFRSVFDAAFDGARSHR